MALPANIDPNSPASTDQISSGDDQIRALKQFLIDIFGLPANPTNMTAALLDANADGTIASSLSIALKAVAQTFTAQQTFAASPLVQLANALVEIDATTGEPSLVFKRANAVVASIKYLSTGTELQLWDATTKRVSWNLTTGEQLTGVVLAHTHAVASVSRADLTTAQGIATGTSGNGLTITMNDYAFFPSFRGNGTLIGSIGPAVGSTVGHVRMSAGAGQIPIAEWRYITASDDPTVWVSYDAAGVLKAVWLSDDPLPSGEIGVCAQINGIDQNCLQIPRADLVCILSEISPEAQALGESKATTLDKVPFRILYAAFPNPAQTIINRGKIVNGALVSQ